MAESHCRIALHASRTVGRVRRTQVADRRGHKAWPSPRLLIALGATLLVLLFPLSVLAEGESIGGTLLVRVGDERTPVEGVSITVSQDGTEIGTAISDADGKWQVPLPGEGTYQVTLDVSSLPEGVALTDPTKAELPAVSVLGGQQKVVIGAFER